MAYDDIDVCVRCDSLITESAIYYGNSIGWKVVWQHEDGQVRCFAPDAQPSSNAHLARAYILFRDEDPRNDYGYWDELSNDEQQEYLRRTEGN